MKRFLLIVAAAGLTAAGSMAAAQTIAPQCAASVVSADIPQGYDVVFDADRGVCLAAPTEAIVSTQVLEGGLAGIGLGGAIVGAAVLTFVAISTTGGT